MDEVSSLRASWVWLVVWSFFVEMSSKTDAEERGLICIKVEVTDQG